MTDQAMRCWCAETAYPGLKSIIFGTFLAPVRDGEEAVRQLVLKELSKFLPALPEILRLIPGSVVFVPEGGDA